MLLLNTTTPGASALSLSNICFHCLERTGAGAKRRAGTVAIEAEKVLPVIIDQYGFDSWIANTLNT